MRGSWFAGVLAVSASGCQFPRPGDAPSDASPVDAPIDARPEFVQGSWKYRHLVGTTVAESPLDLSAFTVQALVPSGTGFATIGGIAHADGAFEIDNVPPGTTYLLRIGRSSFVTDQHALVLRNIVPTRADTTAATQPTAVTFQVDAAFPFEVSDELRAVSIRADLDAPLVHAPGQTTVEQVLEWTSQTSFLYAYGPGRLADLSAGDDFTLLHYRVSQSAPGERVVKQIVAVDDLDVTVRDGQPTTVPAMLRAPARTFSLAGGLGLGLYAAGHSPLTRPSHVTTRCAALPGPALDWQSEGAAHLEPPLVEFRHDSPVPAAIDLSGTFGDPFPPDWQRYCTVEVHRTRSLRIPGTSPYAAGAVTQRAAIASALIGTPVAPPTAIRIRGLDGERGGLLRNDGLPVEMSWTGSAQASQYLVTIDRLVAQGTRTSPVLLIRIATTDTSITIPAEFLAGSDFIGFTVTAVNSTNAYATGTLTPSGIPGGAASAVTAMFRWSATCGDSTPDVGEACDAGSETAACDSDCTLAECGDGTRNVAAGELCDSIVDTPGCDSDCTANVCGDGHRNAETEQCDDGGAAPGDGCSASCQTE